eukprot:TRINITY_DN9440_c0_g1_i4.p1 TRINITY_DN9440_c0_g1~~TRINITY_DN9440_c0_g1_i4.p1  ORF type:complete len:294 (-),score=71.85 TRINITY_DN9440_c0_g1_i4:358-1239(-)
MPTLTVLRIDGDGTQTPCLEAHFSAKDKVKTLKARVEECLGGLECKLVADGGAELLEDSTIEGAGLQDEDCVGAFIVDDKPQISSTAGAYAALKPDGSVVTWGDEERGGDSSSVKDFLASGVIRVSATSGAFAALRKDGSVTAWGAKALGGDAEAVRNELLQGVQQIVATHYAFAALKLGGRVVCWGDRIAGGDCNAVATQLDADVQKIYATTFAFAALKKGGCVVTWGDKHSGGDSSKVEKQLAHGVCVSQSLRCRQDKLGGYHLGGPVVWRRFLSRFGTAQGRRSPSACGG